MQFSDTVTMGNLITITVTILGGIGFYWRLAATFGKLQLKVDTLWDAFINERNSNHHHGGGE